MKKLSKVLSVVLTVAMLFTMSFVVSADTYTDVTTSDSYYEAVEALTALGVVKGYETGDFQPEGKITRAEAATMIMRTLGLGAAESNRVDTIFSDVKADHWASGTIAEANGANIINGMGDGTFAPSAEVTYDQVVKMLVCAMGYQKKAEAAVAKGTNPFPTGYNIIANQKKITEGTTKTEGGATRATVARLIYNALPVNLMDQTSFGTNEEYGEVATQSLLYTKLDAIKVEAKINEIDLDPTQEKISVSITKYDDVYAANNSVMGVMSTGFISNVKKGDVALGGLQGLTVSALIDISESDDPVLLAVFPKAGRNTELVIDPSLFAGAASGRLQYKKDADASTLTTEKVEASATEPFNIYVNLTLYKSATTVGSVESELNDSKIFLSANDKTTTNLKSYKFVDTDNDGAFDTLFIEESASFIVDRTDADEQGIYAVTSTSAMNSAATSLLATDNIYLPLDLDTEDETVSYVITDSEGNELTFDDIKAGDILTVAKSEKNGYYFYDIAVATAAAVEGTISEVSSKKLTGAGSSAANLTLYTIDGTAYRVNGAANAGSKLEAGTAGKFQITADGSIIAWELEASAKTFGVLVAMANNTNSFSSGVQAQVITADGTIKTYNLADKFSIDNKADVTSATVSASDSGDANTLNDTFVIDGVTVTSGTIVMFETNKDDEIRRMYTTEAAMKVKDEDIRIETLSSAEYNAVSGKISGRYFTEASTIVGVKNNLVDDKDKYSVATVGALDEVSKYNGTAVYDNGSKEISFAVITNLDIKPAYDSEAMVITGIATTSVDGESRDKVTGYIGTKEVSYTVAASDDVDVYALGASTASSYTNGTTLKANEAIQFVLNANDEIIAIRELVAYVGADLCATRVATAYVGDDTDDVNRGSTSTASVKDTVQIVKLKDLTVVTAVGSVAEFFGYGVAGKVNLINGANIEFFKNAAYTAITEVYAKDGTTFNNGDVIASGDLKSASETGFTIKVYEYAGKHYKTEAAAKDVRIADIQTSTNLYSATFTGTAYFYGPGYNKVKTGSLASVKTFEGLGKDVTKIDASTGKSTCEDIVYTYSYDGTNVLNYVYDPADNSK